MAQYVVLETGRLNNNSRIVVHSDIPSGTNEVGTTWQQALVDMQGTPFESVVPPSIMPSGRQADLDSGQVFEWSFQATYNANETPANKQAAIEAQIQTMEAETLGDLQDKLRFWGFTGSVV